MHRDNPAFEPEGNLELKDVGAHHTTTHKVFEQRPQTKLGKLRLLMWKNQIQRRRHWLLFLLELVIPTGLMCLACYLRIIPEKDLVLTPVNENTTGYKLYETVSRRTFCSSTHGYWHTLDNRCEYDSDASKTKAAIFWGPKTEFTSALMTKFQENLNLPDSIFREVSSNEEMDDEVDKAYLAFGVSSNLLFAGFYFHLEGREEDVLPEHLEYDIRLQKLWYTALVYPFLQLPGPRNRQILPYVAGYNTDYFVLLQTVMDRSYISLISSNNSVLENVEMVTQMFPYPPYLQDNGLNQLYGSLLPTFVVFALVLLSPTLIKGIVHEKETGVRELVRMMGMEPFLNWIGWFMYSFVSIFVISIVIVLFLKVEITSPDTTGKIPPVLPFTNTFVLWIYIILYCTSSIVFCMAISCFFNKPSLATTIGVLAWILSFYIPASLMNSRYDEISLGPKLISCLLPNMAMTWLFKIIAMFEGRGSGLQWNNLFETGNAEDQLTPGYILIMLIVDIGLFILITWYVDKIRPGTYGVPLPWYFPFQLSYYKSVQHETTITSEDESQIDSDSYEPEPKGLPNGIKIKHLRKEFKTIKGGTKVAVDDVSFSCYKGQCTVLLGHNGAGKTTTMSVITGVYPATSGYAEINGYNISTDLKKAREAVGLCPQHNTLFVDLSVKEHLLFFAMLKGLTKKQAEKDAHHLLQKLQLQEKKDNFGKMLSGGMKRKLCLAIALIGNSKIVILDEPSSGLDPESRRWVWDVLQQERASRTLLVTTHHMEEADVLGDRVAIMSRGKVACCGSTLFLKKKFGEGYTLAVSIAEDCLVDNISQYIHTLFPLAFLKNQEGRTLFYILPPETAKFSRLLEELTEEKKLYRIEHLSLYLTSMEQVFLRVSESQKKVDEDDSTLKLGSSIGHGSVELVERQSKDERLNGFRLVLRRLQTLLRKKIIYTKRKWLLLITQSLIPILVTLLCLAVDASFSESDYVEPSRKLTLDMFDYTYSYLEPHSLPELDQNYKNLFIGSNEITETDDLQNSLFSAAYEDLTVYRENYIVATSFTEKEEKLQTLMMYQSIPYHCPGIGTNLISNALLHSSTGNDLNFITTNNYPLTKNKEWRLDDDQSSYSSTLYSMTMPIALAFLTSSFLVFPLNERVSKAKQIQLMTGTSSVGLWATSFSWDMISYFISAVLIFACFMAFDTKSFFKISGARGSLFLMLVLYGFGSIPMAYVFSFFFENSASGFSFLALLNVISGMIMSIVVYALDVAGVEVASDVLRFIFSFIPAFVGAQGFKNIVDMSSYNTQCDILDESQQDSLCPIIPDISPYLLCCPQCAEYGECFEVLDYLTWKYPGMGQPLFYLFVDGVFYFLILFIIEKRFINKLWLKGSHYFNQFRKKPMEIQKKKKEVDQDVREESEIAHSLISKPNSDAALVVNNLCKTFEKTQLSAVDGISFHVKKGECLGLLGVNGAGKTTTFRMLTGDEDPTHGEARIGSNFLRNNRRRFLRDVGYCPQFDAIIEELTGEEMLDLMAGLRGVPQNKCKPLIAETIAKMDLTECSKRPCGTYSGGNKRKLSTGMAFIGCPPLVFLDEPTSGVDPASRRKVWDAVESAISSKESIVLTSHSMDECEALCNRVVIMAKGTLRCAGTPLHLKHKFGKGYTVQVKTSTTQTLSDVPGDLYEQLADTFKETFKEYFPIATLSDEHRGMLSYQLSGDHTWSYIFEVMESIKNGLSLPSKFPPRDSSTLSILSSFVEDYAVMDPSLEQVFLSFAREAENS